MSHPSRALAWLLAAVFVLCAEPAGAQDRHALIADQGWHLFAVEFARSDAVLESRLVQGADAGARVAMAWYFFVALGYDRVVLVDCGTDAFAPGGRPALRASWSVARGVRATVALARLGIDAADVTDVVLTHHHWDHVGALASFPTARIHVHQSEWSRVPERLRRGPERAGRVATFHRRERALWPGFVARVSGAHTRRHVMVELRCADRPIVILGDAAYLYRNVEERVPVAVSADAVRNVAEVARAVAAVGAANVLPGHDPTIFERYPSGVEGVAAVCP